MFSKYKNISPEEKKFNFLVSDDLQQVLSLVEDLCHKIRATHACIQILDIKKEMILNTEKSQSLLHSAPVLSPFLHILIWENFSASGNTGECQQFIPNPVLTTTSRHERFLLPIQHLYLKESLSRVSKSSQRTTFNAKNLQTDDTTFYAAAPYATSSFLADPCLPWDSDSIECNLSTTDGSKFQIVHMQNIQDTVHLEA